MAKRVIAVFLGIISFPLLMFVGEEFNVATAFILTGFYYLVAQFFLSRGNPRALYEDWPLMLFLNAALIVVAVLILIIEPDAKYTAIVAVISMAGSAVGAWIATMRAKHPAD
jgi:lipoprotein signal peptidase